jgi:Protein of unknown function (DUF3558)
MRTLRIALASLLLVAGCSTSRAGAPAPADDPTSTTEQSGEPTESTENTTTATTTEGPNRPKDVDLAPVDPCALLNKMPVRTWGLDGRKPVNTNLSRFPGAKACFSNGTEKIFGLTLAAVTDTGTGEYLDTVNAKITEYDAQGYPLYTLTNPQVVNGCLGVLDVHDGQFVYISYGRPDLDAPVIPTAKLCKTLTEIAAATVKALG